LVQLNVGRLFSLNVEFAEYIGFLVVVEMQEYEPALFILINSASSSLLLSSLSSLL